METTRDIPCVQHFGSATVSDDPTESRDHVSPSRVSPDKLSRERVEWILPCSTQSNTACLFTESLYEFKVG
jgi:hypothetical protein